MNWATIGVGLYAIALAMACLSEDLMEERDFYSKAFLIAVFIFIVLFIGGLIF